MILGEIFKCVFLETEYDGHVKFFLQWWWWGYFFGQEQNFIS